VDTTDGVKVILDGGWVLVRPSGTEPLVRVFGEARSEDEARRIVEQAKGQVEKLAKELA
jgi:phosphomannomutase